jgi:hypothetical protein
VPTIGWEVAVDGTDINLGGGGDGGGAAAATPPPSIGPDWSPLKCVTYVITYLLMTGYFARSAIMILDYTEGGPGGSSKTKEEGGINQGGGGRFGGGGGSSRGGHVLILNWLALQLESADPARQQLDLIRRN